MWNIEAPEWKHNQRPQYEISLSQHLDLPQLSQFSKEALRVNAVSGQRRGHAIAGLDRRHRRRTDCAPSSASFCVWETVHNPHCMLLINIRCQGQAYKKAYKPNSLQIPLAFRLGLPEPYWVPIPGLFEYPVLTPQWLPIPRVSSLYCGRNYWMHKVLI